MATDVKNDASLGANLVAVYPFTDASGNQTDESGNGYDLTDVGSVTTTTGLNGDKAADFESANNEHLYRSDPFHISNNLSISLWVKYESFTGDNRLVDKWYSGSEYIIRSNNTTPGVLVSCSSGNATANGATASTGVWYHYVLTYNTTDGVKFYIDAGTPATGAAKGTINNTTEPFTVGCARSTGGSTTSFHDGLLWQVLVYDKTLTATDVSNLYNSGAGIPWDAAGGGPVTNNAIFAFGGM